MVSSYMGALGRDMVRIIVPDWRLVTQEAKEELVTSDLKQALEDGWSDDEINSKLQLEGVDLADWFTFRKERESTAFKETSKKFKELRSKHKLPHTTSRKGYARLEEEMLLLKEKINECQKRSSASSSQSINKDPIAQVFGPEHQGRVRGLGFGVTPSNVRATTQSTILVRKLQADFRRLEEKHEQLAELIRSQQMPLSSRQLSPEKIVGEGEVETDDPMHLVDGIPIGGNAYLVYVERVFEPNAFLWRNQNNWTTLDNALGEPMIGYGVAKVLDSQHPDFNDGDFVWGLTGWEEYSLIQEPGELIKIKYTDVPLSYYTGILIREADGLLYMLSEVSDPMKSAFVALNSRVFGGQEAGFGAWGCFAFGEDTKDIITTNLEKLLVSNLVQLRLCVNLFLTFHYMINYDVWFSYDSNQEKLPQNMVEVAKQDKVANCEDDQVSGEPEHEEKCKDEESYQHLPKVSLCVFAFETALGIELHLVLCISNVD
ncbi:hypothetical protein Sjap_020293 [Stephania japonica]|uniref:Oxidoreductase N-terminal domain-containing protein n=1 Tax=Stephania japonica TaxID=461633 RepID=A0AAP0F155_9MAGN